MKVNTKKRKKARRDFEQMYGKQEMIDRMYPIVSRGKQGLARHEPVNESFFVDIEFSIYDHVDSLSSNRWVG